MKMILSALSLSFIFASSALAQCYGDAAESFGCRVSAPNEDTLESFGDSRTEVAPDYYGYSRQATANDLFSHQESMQRYKRIYSGWHGNRWSEQAFRNSVNRSAQPIRAWGSRQLTRPRF
jgi:hypothetical protein